MYTIKKSGIPERVPGARPVKPGDLFPVWWNTGPHNPPNMATVQAVMPYTGRYREDFNAVLRLSAPNTSRGWLEMSVKL